MLCWLKLTVYKILLFAPILMFFPKIPRLMGFSDFFLTVTGDVTS